MIVVYGLKNCDTCRKATKWLGAENINHRFVDIRRDGISSSLVSNWLKAVGWENLLNRKSTTWRGLSDPVKAEVNEASVLDLLVENPTLIKRPVIDHDGAISVGFKDTDKARLED